MEKHIIFTHTTLTLNTTNQTAQSLLIYKHIYKDIFIRLSNFKELLYLHWEDNMSTGEITKRLWEEKRG